MISAKNPLHSMALWLFAVAGLVLVMSLVGAITRLTGSGLSMAEWRPLMGTIPPLSESEWLRVFGVYRETPEFRFRNSWMTLEDFKAIFFWEWFHRVLGRVIGLAYAFPLLVFWIRGRIPRGFYVPLVSIFVLGAAQGVMGWYMVASGLVDVPAVSHFRLAAHLGLALLIGSLCVWYGLALQEKADACSSTHFRTLFAPPAYLSIFGWACFYLLMLTMIWGAFTAGLDGGLVYDTFPLMGGRWIPSDIGRFFPLWVDFFQNPVGVQFVHRWLGVASAVVLTGYWFVLREAGCARKPDHAIPVLVGVQITLGISVLYTGVWVPLAVAHQGVAVLILFALTKSLFHLSRGRGR